MRCFSEKNLSENMKSLHHIKDIIHKESDGNSVQHQYLASHTLF